MKKIFCKTNKIVIIIIAIFCLISIGTESFAVKKDIKVKKIEFDKKICTLQNVGSTVKIKAKVTPSNATNKKLVWSSTNPIAATVNNGKITAQGNGSSIIIAKTQDGTVSASCYVFVGSSININRFYYNQFVEMKNNTAKDTYYVLYKEIYSDVLKNGNAINYSKLPDKVDLVTFNGTKQNRDLMEISINIGHAGFLFDNPNIFYAEFYKPKKDIKGNSCHWYYELELPAECNGNKEKLAEVKKRIDNTTKAVLKAAKKKSNDYEKIKYIHNWILNNTNYDYSLNNDYTGSIYGVLRKNDEVVCRGYSQTLKYLLNKLNIECITVIGTGFAKNIKMTFAGEGHVWNYVKLNNKWYGVDCTWDDGINSGKRSYAYFLKGSNVFKSSGWDSNGLMHVVSDSVKYPKLNSKDYK